MLELLQHVVVTFVAAGAAWIVVRRAFAAVRPRSGAHDCASCPAHATKAPHAPAASPGPAPTQPLILVKRTRV